MAVCEAPEGWAEPSRDLPPHPMDPANPVVLHRVWRWQSVSHCEERDCCRASPCGWNEGSKVSSPAERDWWFNTVLISLSDPDLSAGHRENKIRENTTCWRTEASVGEVFSWVEFHPWCHWNQRINTSLRATFGLKTFFFSFVFFLFSESHCGYLHTASF